MKAAKCAKKILVKCAGIGMNAREENGETSANGKGKNK